MTLLAFIFGITFLVAAHELGHYLIARLCHVKVLRFSIGFGRPLWIFKRGATEWAFCAIPLGGYVKLLGDRNHPTSAKDRSLSFGVQSLGKRVAIIVAGPIASLLLAVLLSFFVLLQGEEQIKPLVGTVVPQTPAAAAGFIQGERITSVDNHATNSWQDVQSALLESKNHHALNITVVNASGKVMIRKINLMRFVHESPQLIYTDKIGLYAERMLPIIGQINPNGAAAKAGLQVGDRLLFVGKEPILNWQQFVMQVKNNPGKLLQVVVKRGEYTKYFSVRLNTINENGFPVGHIGLMGLPDMTWYRQLTQFYQPNFWEALQMGFQRTMRASWMTLSLIGRVVLGDIPLTNHMVGPLTIARLAGETAHLGWLVYLKFLALVSMSLGVINLLPIPILDGGRLVYCAIEWINRRPLSVRVQEKCDLMGMLFLFFLMATALFNDFSYFLAS
jgi:regulator of sigma E protease